MCLCSTNIQYTRAVNDFLKKNNLLLTPIDKSKNICILPENEYKNKLREFFGNQERFIKKYQNSNKKNGTIRF